MKRVHLKKLFATESEQVESGACGKSEYHMWAGRKKGKKTTTLRCGKRSNL